MLLLIRMLTVSLSGFAGYKIGILLLNLVSPLLCTFHSDEYREGICLR